MKFEYFVREELSEASEVPGEESGNGDEDFRSRSLLTAYHKRYSILQTTS